MDGIALILLDALLILVLLGLAWATLESRDPRRGVVLFIAFGLVLALVWARLAAPDVALAEAAIGAGLSGALLLAALRDEPEAGPEPSEPEPELATPARRRLAGLTDWALGLLCLGLGLVVAWAFVDALAGADPERLAGQVLARIGESGVSNPVTAVLLNFRGYDTLLELAVLLAALLGILALGPERGGYDAGGSGPGRAGGLAHPGAHPHRRLPALGRRPCPRRCLPGRRHTGRRRGDPASDRGPGGGSAPGPALRALSLAGVAVFLGVGLALLVAGRPFLGFPPAWAGTLILVIESAATLAIGAILALAFIGGRPAAWDSPQQRRALNPTRVRNQP